MLFSVFERAKVQIISIASKKMLFFVKNNSLICSCLFDGECPILRPYLLTSAMLYLFLQSAEKHNE